MLIAHYINYHLSRAEKGLLAANQASDIAPLSQQIIGMQARFAALISVLTDMLAQLDGRQDWFPGFLQELSTLETEECPPPT